MSKIIPKNVSEEFERNLRAAGGSKSKIEGAKRLAGSRLIMSKGNSWWNENYDTIRAELAEIEKKVQGRESDLVSAKFIIEIRMGAMRNVEYRRMWKLIREWVKA